MAQYRFRTTALIGEWRPSRKEACEDALRVGLARSDHHRPDGVNWAVPGDIESSDPGSLWWANMKVQ